MTSDPSTLCPVCGYNLEIQPWKNNLPSDEICPCCGIQFGYNDSIQDLEKRNKVYKEWRQNWINQGMPWDMVGKSLPPPHWSPLEQMKSLKL